MKRDELIAVIKERRSYLCVGLDTDVEKIPQHLKNYDDPVFEFNKLIIDATRNYCIAYKPNIAFYEALGSTGWKSLEKTVAYIGNSHFKIADAKRGDIGNSSAKYAEAFFKAMDFDAVTVAPYMGEDSIRPFLTFENKWVIVLALTSNTGSRDFQFAETGNERLFEKVIKTAGAWGDKKNMMFVIGATHPEYFKEIRRWIADSFLLVPGVGAQGGDLKTVSENAMMSECGLIVNSTRDIIYASDGDMFAELAASKARHIQREMEGLLKAHSVI